MGACATCGKKTRKPSGATTEGGISKGKNTNSGCYDSPTKAQGDKLGGYQEGEKYQYRLSQESDKYFVKYSISQADFKDFATSKSQSYYMIFYKYRNIAEQLGEVSPDMASSKLIKNVAKLKIIKDKVERDFQTQGFIPKKDTPLPIISEEVLIYTLKYAKILIDIFESLEKDPNYEGLFPILSFSFKDLKQKLQAILVEIDTLRTNSQAKHKNPVALP